MNTPRNTSELQPADHPAGDAYEARAVLDQLPVIVAGLRGPDHRYAVMNAALRTFMSDRQVYGVPVREAFPEIAGQQIYEAADRVYQTGTPEYVPEMRVQFDADGSGTLQEFFLDWTAVPNRAADGETVGVIVQFIDVTERVHERLITQARASEAQRRYEAARDVVADMQAALLPTTLPVLPGVLVAASHLLADADTAAGGDWFDAFVLDDGRLALVVGDVVGHGVAASATMGQLRVVLRERLAATDDLAAALDAVDRLASTTPGGRAATVCAVVLDPHSGALSYCTAGHPPPLVVDGVGEPRYLTTSGAGPLGVGSQFPLAEDRLATDEMLLLYTDGILERPGRDVASSIVELSRVATDIAANRALRGDPGSPVDRVTTQTLELLTRATGHTDDITLLAVARREPAPPLHLDLPAAASAIPTARSAAHAWAERLEASEEDRVALDHVVVELVTNAYEHAPPDPSDRVHATISLTADLHDDGAVRLTVSDNGRWRHRATHDGTTEPGRGFGLAMTAALSDRIDIDRTDAGTTVTVRRVISRPARLLTPGRIAAGRRGPARDASEPMRIDYDPGGRRISVRGALDAGNAEDLGAELDRLSLAGTQDLIVDLSAVTHLASAAVAELYRSTPDGTRNPLRLYAPLDSTAHHVLDLVSLPHDITEPGAVDPDGSAGAS